MTTFTLQDLTPEQQQAVNNHEEMHKMFQAMNPATTQDVLNNMAIPMPPLNAPEPQPTPIGTDVPNIDAVINTICTQLQLLSTVIKGERAQGNSHAEDQSLQECLTLTLKQADWFRDIVRQELVALDIESIAESALENQVEREVTHYFDVQFDPEDHFDFGDAVENAVDDRLDDIVRDRVMDSLEEVVAEKLSEASVSISF